MITGASKIRVGRLLPGGAEVGEGANKPIRGIAATQAGEIAVVAKQVSSREIAVEVICALLGRAAGLPIPEPLLLLDQNNVWHYGSADVGHPNLAQFVSTTNPSVLDELERWPELLSAACFDELIANPDRHDGNLLYDGAGFFLIDHGLCIPRGMPAAELSDDYHSNQLLDIHISTCRDEVAKQRSVNCSKSWVMENGERSIDQAEQASAGGLDGTSQQQLLCFLKGRVAILGDLLHDRIKPRQQRRLF